MRPDRAEHVRAEQLRREEAPGRPLRASAQHEPVMIRDFTKSNNKWNDGVVTDRAGPVSYTVKKTSIFKKTYRSVTNT